jgi:hypothetical protein
MTFTVNYSRVMSVDFETAVSIFESFVSDAWALKLLHARDDSEFPSEKDLDEIKKHIAKTIIKNVDENDRQKFLTMAKNDDWVSCVKSIDDMPIVDVGPLKVRVDALIAATLQVKDDFRKEF